MWSIDCVELFLCVDCILSVCIAVAARVRLLMCGPCVLTVLTVTSVVCLARGRHPRSTGGLKRAALWLRTDLAESLPHTSAFLHTHQSTNKTPFLKETACVPVLHNTHKHYCNIRTYTQTLPCAG